jgi:hypothetical protein
MNGRSTKNSTDVASDPSSQVGTLRSWRSSIPLNLRHWDMEFDGIAVEFDEYLHFNRYRSITLKSSVYEDLRGFPSDDYQRYCSERGRSA